MARVQEGFYSRNITNTTGELLFFIDQTDDEATARDALVNEAPGVYDRKFRDDYRIERIGPSLFKGTVQYKTKAMSGLPVISGVEPNRQIEFSTGGGSRRQQFAISTTRTDAAGWTGDNTGNPINVDESGRINGCDIVIPRFNFRVRRRMTASQLTDSYVDTLINATGTINSDAWKGFAAGEVLFMGADGSQVFDEGDVVFSFMAGKNLTGQTVAGIANISFKPFDYVWVRYVTETGTNATKVVAKEVHVCSVYRSTAFSAFNL